MRDVIFILSLDPIKFRDNILMLPIEVFEVSHSLSEAGSLSLSLSSSDDFLTLIISLLLTPLLPYTSCSTLRVLLDQKLWMKANILVEEKAF